MVYAKIVQRKINTKKSEILVVWNEIIMTASTNINKETVEYIDNSTNRKLKKKAFRIGEHLLVSYVGTKDKTYQIFKAINGKPLFPAIFAEVKDAVEFAEFIDETYQDYLLLLENYPDADVFALSKWSVRNGIKIYETINELNKETQPVTQNDISSAAERAVNYVFRWTRNFRRST
jgi:hypothetical protein